MKLSFGGEHQLIDQVVRPNFNAEAAKDSLNKNALTPLGIYSRKSNRNETAETAKPWVETCFVGKVCDVSVSLRGKIWIKITGRQDTIVTIFYNRNLTK